MRNLKKRVMAAAVALALVLVAGCTSGGSDGAGAGSGGDSLSKIQKSGKLRYAVIVGEEPGFIKKSDGSWSGYLADTAQMIAKDLTLEPVPVVTTWGNMALDLKTDKLDIAVGVQPTGARALVVDYTTHPIYTNYFSLIVTSDKYDKMRWEELNDPKNKIGAQNGDSTLQPIARFAPKADVKKFDSRDKNLLALQSGQVDASANTLLNSLMATKSRKDLDAHVVVPEPLVAAPSAVMVARSADQSFLKSVDAVVWNLNASGAVRESIMRHLATYGITAADLPDNALL